MDRKSTIVIVICFVFLLLWSKIINTIYPPIKASAPHTNLVLEAQSGALSNAANATTSTPPVLSALTTPMPPFPTNAPEQIIVLTNSSARYVFTSRGGGLKSVELVRYPETTSRQPNARPATNTFATLNAGAPLPVLALLPADALGDGNFNLTATPAGLRAEKTLPGGLHVMKEFQLGTNYLLNATVRFENLSTQIISLPPQEWVVGAATPMGPDDKGFGVGMMWYNGSSKQDIAVSWFQNLTLGCIPGVPRPEYRVATSNILWAAAHNQFFTLTAMPKESPQEILSRPVDLPPPIAQELSPNLRNLPPPKGIETAFVYPALSLAPGQSLERQITFFAGPKEYRTLASIAQRFQNNVDLVMGFSGFFGFFSKALLLGMNALHEVFKIPYGWAIIVITVLIRLLFWPLTQASTRSMKRMQALQPQMNAIKEKYKDDAVKMNKKVMEFMKENKVSPLGGCLPMALQMPVFFGFYYMIRSAIELRGASFLWVTDLTKPDTLFIIPVLNFPFNLLPLLMGATMLWQARLAPPSPGVDPAQANMMKYLPLVFLVGLYNFSAALALYWTVSNLLSITQTKLTRAGTSPSQESPPASVLTPASKKKK